MRSGRIQKLLITGLCGVLVIGIIGVSLPPRKQVYFKAPTPLTDMLLSCPPDWQWEDRPLGETEYMVEKVAKTLRFDQALYRVYRKDDCEVGVYVAYWNPGGMDPWLIALHTPDICWVGNGAQIIKRNNQRILIAADDKVLTPGHFRIFEWTQKRQEVVFWHLYGGKPSGFPVTDGSRLSARWRELQLTLRNTLGGRVRKEQVFVRLSTNRTFDELTRSDLWPMLVKSLAPTGLIATSSKDE